MIKYFINFIKKYIIIILTIGFFTPIFIGFITGVIYYLITNPFSLNSVSTSNYLLGAYTIYILTYPIKIIFQGFLTSLLLYSSILGFLTILMFTIAFVSGVFLFIRDFGLFWLEISGYDTKTETNIIENLFGSLLCFLLLYYVLLPVGINGIFGDGGNGLISNLFYWYLSHVDTIKNYFYS